jgi:hypothetical protein
MSSPDTPRSAISTQTLSWQEAVNAMEEPWSGRLFRAGEFLENIQQTPFMIGERDKIAYFAGPIPNHDRMVPLTITAMNHLYPWFYQTIPVAITTQTGSETIMGDIQFFPGCKDQIIFWGCTESGTVRMVIDVHGKGKYERTSSLWKKASLFDIQDDYARQFYALKEERDYTFVMRLPGKIAPAMFLAGEDVVKELMKQHYQPKYAARGQYKPGLRCLVNAEYEGRSRSLTSQVRLKNPENGEWDVVGSTEMLKQHTEGVALLCIDKRFASKGVLGSGYVLHTFLLYGSGSGSSAKVEESIRNFGRGPSVPLLTYSNQS